MPPDGTIDLFLRQHGVLSRAQARRAGLTDHAIRTALESRTWERVARGVFRHRAVVPTWKSELMAACLTVDGIVSHRSAARLLGLDGFGDQHVEVTVAQGRWRPVDGFVLHQSTQLHLVRPLERDGLPLTDLARTVLDVAAVVPRRRLDDVVDQVIRTGRLRWRHLYAVVALHSQRGRNGCGYLRRLLEDRFGEDSVPLSAWNRMAADVLIAHGLPEPRMEYRICDEEGSLIAQVDLAYHAARVVIELESRRHHHTASGFERDRARYRRLAAAGWIVLPLTWKQFMEDTASFVADVRRALWLAC